MIRLLASIVLLFALAGCQADVAQQLRAARASADTALDIQHAAVVSGALRPADVAAVLPYEKAIYAALDAGQKAALAGDTNSAQVFLQAALTGLQKYAAIVPAKAATKPSP